MAHEIPDHPPLLPCPFCGRPASVATYRAARDRAVTYSAGCFKSTDWRDPEHFCDACLGPMSNWFADLGRAVELCNTRGRPAGRP